MAGHSTRPDPLERGGRSPPMDPPLDGPSWAKLGLAAARDSNLGPLDSSTPQWLARTLLVCITPCPQDPPSSSRRMSHARCSCPFLSCEPPARPKGLHLLGSKEADHSILAIGRAWKNILCQSSSRSPQVHQVARPKHKAHSPPMALTRKKSPTCYHGVPQEHLAVVLGFTSDTCTCTGLHSS